MSNASRALKRVLIGRAMRSDRLGETLLPKRIALPVFASDALSSVAYAPDEIFLTLAAAGGAMVMTHSWQIGLAVAFVMAIVVMSYRQNVHAYPSGGGDYEVATVNLGAKAGVTVASALLVDYVLTVAVSVSSGVQNAAAALPQVRGHETEIAVVLVILLTAMNLRGVRESGTLFAIPTYAFMIGVVVMAVVGFVRAATGTLPMAESAQFELAPEPGMESLAGFAMVFLMLRAFSSGCAALTGVEAISNGVPAFRKPKSSNAAMTLLLMGSIAVTMLLSIIVLARQVGLKFAEFPAEQLLLNGRPVGDSYVQETVLGQLAGTVFHDFPPGLYYIATVTGIILILAANTAFNGFPVLASVLAKDGYLPRQLHTRGDRLAFSNGILILAGAACVLIVAYEAKVTELIQLYIVGVFVSFTLSQAGMIRHWNRLLPEATPAERRQMRRSRAINWIGATMSALVLAIVMMTKFERGAKWAIAAMIVVFFVMQAINRHYRAVSRELALGDDPREERALPSRVRAIVLVSQIHKPTMRAVAYARASRPSHLEAITVDVEAEQTAALAKEWDRREIPVPLTILDSPYREITRPILEWVKELRTRYPEDVVTVYVPEYVVGHWWEHILHNQSALRLKAALLFTPGVMMVSVPWQLSSSAGAESWFEAVEAAPTAGAARRGE
ncbi:APC family permease [Austwickia sp. TVS 96-490-7B]|uniref:APC family permease n=1 Tax=Austwickia sp. TVS 96-490-7B TaxID=2830843 RepID=UPI001C58E0B8|nr:APC family permease [Austwickia sp. TVS 96-490-7B]